jgi:hypothetical protein
MNETFPNDMAGVNVERRRSHRESVVAIGKLSPLDASDTTRPMQILVTDLSLHGCDFKTAVLPRDGAYYQINLSVGPLSMNSRVRVIRCTPRADGTYEVGGEFI